MVVLGILEVLLKTWNKIANPSVVLGAETNLEMCHTVSSETKHDIVALIHLSIETCYNSVLKLGKTYMVSVLVLIIVDMW